MAFTAGGNHFIVNYTVGWFTLALVNAGLAQAKRLSGGTWFLLSLVLGPIATLMLLFRDGR
jgi:hypothetical protein